MEGEGLRGSFLGLSRVVLFHVGLPLPFLCSAVPAQSGQRNEVASLTHT